MTGVLYGLGLPPTLIPQFEQNAEPSLTAVPQLGQYFILISSPVIDFGNKPGRLRRFYRGAQDVKHKI